MSVLSPDERTVISAIQFNARTPVRKVAADTGLDHRKVRRAMRDLTESGRIYPVSRVSYANLGLIYHVVWASLLISARQESEALLERIMLHPNIVWASSCWGDFDLEIGIVAGNEHQAQDVLSSLGGFFSHTLRGTERYSLTFEKNYISGTRQRKEAFFGPSGLQAELDDLDFLAVELLQANPLSAYNVLSELAGVPENTLRTRILRLQKLGVIVGSHYFLKLQELALGSTRMLIQFQFPTPQDDEQMRAFCRDTPCITSLGRYVGSYDYELTLEGELRDFRKVKDQVAAIFGTKLRDITTIPLDSTLKCTFNDVRRAVRCSREGTTAPSIAYF